MMHQKSKAADVSTLVYRNPTTDVVSLMATECSVENIYNVPTQVVYTNSSLNQLLQRLTSELGAKDCTF